ncbi:DNA-processing protein DprA [Maridesulfovibrio hydrothermalis]|uniref:DNA protecting protein DprA n=1 Tax=Maridesulfovibrio hydrothermalis AM13 = DSM 14728 TaxID=1121451 RepID=L0RCX3_9BACT|nr:DNA-processing protein DprA [Maridesulfovibrio hydrothermalis]CCO24072.1 DNA protecting protein DprA [Maridesulfovibrio hydrothermalis AM13 = DSM 14728]
MNSLKEEYFACLALRHTPGLGPKSWAGILNHYSRAYEALKSAAEWHSLGLASEKSADGAAKELWRRAAEKEFKDAMRLRFGILPWTHPAFPAALKEIPDPPTYLYYYGDPALLGNAGVAVVGARKSSKLGLDYARKISAELSRKGITVISGFAKGIDGCAHRAALSGIGSSIAVLGTGLDVADYPSDSEELRSLMIEKGLILSEFSPGTRPYSGNFPFRNRIISGISSGVLVAEADVASGSLITARLAAEQGREVMAMPGPLGEKNFSGCLKLIKEGAALVETAEDVLMNIGHTLDVSVNDDLKTKSIRTIPKKDFGSAQRADPENNIIKSVQSAKIIVDIDSLDPPESDIARALEKDGKLHIDEIARNAGLAVSVTGAVILGMEVKGIVVRFPGMYYDLNRC